MNGAELIKALIKQLRVKNQSELAKLLGKNSGVVSSWSSHDLSATTVAGIIANIVDKQVTAEKLIPLLKDRLQIETDARLVELLGMSRPQLHNWKTKRASLTSQQVANAISKAANVATSNARQVVIRPVIEFARISKTKAGKKHDIFNTRIGAKKYHVALRKELAEKQGVYIFYDSRGHAIYVGKTVRQGLWKEINLAFNRNRATQGIKLVRHPTLDFAYKTAEEKDRQIINTKLQLHELAAYFSAFEVENDMISNVEALLVRAFPNDLLNINMERFEFARKKRAEAAKVRRQNKANN